MASEKLLQFKKESPEIPWGFRLIGGVDYNEPLTVIKVSEGSVAENVGMKAGDVLVRINDIYTSNLTHTEAHDVILSGECNFTIVVRRGPKNIEVEISAEEANLERNIIPETGESIETSQKECDLNITDEEIVQIIQGEEQQTETSSHNGHNEHNGYNGILETTKQEIELSKQQAEEDARKWSTFLQKPDKPIRKPKPKKEPDEPKVAPYQVVIKKQKRKSFEAAVALLQEEENATATAQETNVHVEESNKENTTNNCELMADIEHSKICEIKKKATHVEIKDDYVVEYIDEPSDEENEKESEEITEKLENLEVSSKSVRSQKHHKQDNAVSIEEQLAQVQEQLLALSKLPSTIQSTLNAVTRQLEKIASAAHFVDDEDHSYEATTTTEDEITDQNTDGLLSTVIEETNESDGKDETEKDETEKDETVSEQATHSHEASDNTQEEHKVCENGDKSEDDVIEKVESEKEEEIDDGLTPEEREQLKLEQQIEEKKKKDLQVLEEQYQRRLDQRPTMPLTPLERPIILPGGRKWTEPEDACPEPRHRKMSDDTICHTIETYSEVLVGRTKGESNCHLVPSKALQKKNINFLKYQPPPKNLDHLQKSEVYKMIHDTEPSPRGICTRTEKILAAEDYLKEFDRN